MNSLRLNVFDVEKCAHENFCCCCGFKVEWRESRVGKYQQTMQTILFSLTPIIIDSIEMPSDRLLFILSMSRIRRKISTLNYPQSNKKYK